MQGNVPIPIYRRIAEEYRQKILSGELQTGATIPRQTDLAQMHGTSDLTIRKALQLLVDDGLIRRVRKKGTFVNPIGDQRMGTKEALSSNIRKVIFMYNDVALSVLSQEIHRMAMTGMADACSKYGLDFEFVDFRDHGPPSLDSHTGYILYGFEWKSLSMIETWKDQGLKMVTLHNYFPHLDVPYVNCDNVTGGYLATQHLISLGHERIGIILLALSEHELARDWGLRLQGYQLALRNSGIPFDPDLVSVRSDTLVLEEIGRRGGKQLLSLPNRPTAVFAASDFTAIGAIQIAKELGLDVPADVSVIGYDGYSMASYMNPALTTVDQDFYTLGKAGVEKLLDVSPSNSESLISPKIVVRSSTAALSRLSRNSEAMA